jgi:hypothetical protein
MSYSSLSHTVYSGIGSGEIKQRIMLDVRDADGLETMDVENRGELVLGREIGEKSLGIGTIARPRRIVQGQMDV